jgi:cyclic-di-GMP-binding biofilm dispersal mediator protein
VAPRSFDGSTILLAGASGALGSALADALTRQGAKVVAFVRSPERFAATGIAVADVVGGDLTVTADIDRAVARAAALAGGRFHGVINAAGVVAFGPLTELTDEVLDTVFAVNVLGPLRLVRAAVPLLAEGAFVANVSAVVAESPVAGMAAYSASKAALTAADVAVQRELRRSKISVIDARPPHTETGLASRPLAGQPPTLPHGLDPTVVVGRILAAIAADERDLPSSAFTG